MARDSTVARDRVLIVPASLALDGASSQHPNVPQADINQQILEVDRVIYSIYNTLDCFFFHSLLDQKN